MKWSIGTEFSKATPEKKLLTGILQKGTFNGETKKSSVQKERDKEIGKEERFKVWDWNLFKVQYMHKWNYHKSPCIINKCIINQS
jgi:hypothetical protein